MCPVGDGGLGNEERVCGLGLVENDVLGVWSVPGVLNAG